MEHIDQFNQALAAIKGDTSSGAAELASSAARALAALGRGLVAHTADEVLCRLGRACRELIGAQPSMAPIINLANSVLAAAEEVVRSGASAAAAAEAAERAALGFGTRLEENAQATIAHCCRLLESVGGASVAVLTHSYSSTVIAAIEEAVGLGRDVSVVCTESRPGCEGRTVLKRAAACGAKVTYVVDSLMFDILQRRAVDLCLVGADCVTRQSVINKIGTLGLAVAALHFGVPFYCAAGTEKLLSPRLEHLHRVLEHDRREVLEEEVAGVKVLNVYFDSTPLDLLSGLVCEIGVLDPEGLAELFEYPVSPRLL